MTPEPHEPALAVDEPPAGAGGAGTGDPGGNEEQPPPPPPRSRARWVREVVVILAVAFLAAILLREFVVQTFYIPSGSMEPTLQVGDRIVVDKLSYELHGVDRGNIVVFSRPPRENCGGPEVNDLVKRVIGLPGESISLSGGYVYVNGHRLDESWLPSAEQGTSAPGPGGTAYSLNHPYRVPANNYFVMGDNRTDSCDSRWWGPIPSSLIVGKVDLRVWPISSLHLF
ncbi:MAG TPA: signal peptidase I [Acidimicrobiales bacterium]|nr:signal peptidase I [Acidimicrobiales bacterium]